MFSLSALTGFIHLIGLILAVGAATVKTVLLIKCKSDYEYVNAFNKIAGTITRLIIFGLILITLSGIGWIVLGYSLTPILILKIVLVAIVWILGPFIDNVITPKFEKFAPVSGEGPSDDFISIQKTYMVLEFTATGLFYVIIILGVLL